MSTGTRQWTSADAALWHTISIVGDLRNQRVPGQRIATTLIEH